MGMVVMVVVGMEWWWDNFFSVDFLPLIWAKRSSVDSSSGTGWSLCGARQL